MNTAKVAEEAIQQMLASIKKAVIDMLNETSDEFDKMELTKEQREVYNKFTGAFGNKVLSLKLELDQPVGHIDAGRS